jgi:WD40 repeat protein
MKLLKSISSVISLLTVISFNMNEAQSLNFTKLKVLNGHSSTVDSVIQLNDNEIATGSFDSTVKIWDLKDDRVQYTLSGHSTAIYSLEKLDDILTASGSADRTIRIWDYTNGALIQTLTDNSNFVLSLASLNDSFFVSGSLGFFATIKLWDLRD